MCSDVPLLSVLMGVRYRSSDATALRRSVESVLNQTLSDFEFLICADGSCEEALVYLHTAAQRDGRIRLVAEPDALSLPVKLNVCFRESRGAFLARMDDDDFSHPERFERQMRFLREHPQAAFVGCNVALVQDGKSAGVRRLPEYPTVRDFYMTQPYLHPTLVFRRQTLETVNGYSTDRHCLLCEDYDLLLRLYAKGLTGCNLQETLLDYTLSATAKGSRTMVHRWNETVTRAQRFRELGVLGQAWPYVLKPLAVGLMPEHLLAFCKKRHNKTG